MARTLTTQDISWFLDLYDKGQLNLNPSYQRRSVWSPRDKRYFIDTILNNYPAPPIFLHKTLDENGRATYHVVDGKQRLQSIIQFRDGKISIPDDFSDVNLQKKRWKDLNKTKKEEFWNYILIVEMLPDSQESSIRNTFERINRNSRKLTDQEMRHAKYDGWFINRAEAEAELDEWRQIGVVTTARAKRMLDVQFISELMGILIRKSFAGFDQDKIDELYAEYEEINDNGDFVEDDFLLEIKRCKSKIIDMIGIVPDVVDYTKANGHLYTLWSIIALEEPNFSDTERLAKNYHKFIEDVSISISSGAVQDPEDESEPYSSAVSKYASNIRGASTDLSQRQKRYDALLSALEYLASQNSQT